ncbi:hypothetical protein [Streptomyces sp. cg35]|uniref:hypothetical protein n=1 Tax=Streptomyces sp. cg35 TaxID=3421650 RepID=UPI003D167BA4
MTSHLVREIPKRHTPQRRALAQELKDEYACGDLSVLDVAALFGLAPTTAHTLLKEAGTVMRRGPRPDPSFDTVHPDGTPHRHVPGLLGTLPLHTLIKDYA